MDAINEKNIGNPTIRYKIPGSVFVHY